MLKKLLLTIFFIGCLTHISLAQQKTISGKVTDNENGEAIPGVSVIVKGTVHGTVTNAEGDYRIEVDSDETVLVYSSVGYVSQEITVGARSVVDVGLPSDVIALGEVVVIGYGDKSKKLMTESIGAVDSDIITKLPIASADQALQGRLSGVQVTSADATPGSPTAIRIRGVGTVGNSQPLFVIDGIPVGKNDGGNPNGPIFNPLASINPNDIESISVLKDASAAALYGVRAANGVILITTKRGSQNKPSISFDAYYGVQNMPDLWNMATTDQFLELTQEGYDNFNTQQGLDPSDPAYLVLHPDIAPGGFYENIQEDWVSHATNENAPIQSYNMGLTGGNENANYFVSGSYFNQEAVINRYDLERFTFRANGDYKIGGRARFGNTLSLSYTEVDRGVNAGGDGRLLRNAHTMPPFFEIFDYRNEIPGNRYGFNGNEDVAGLTIGNQNGINEIVNNVDRFTRLLGGIYFELEIIDGLRFKTQASIDMDITRNDSWIPGYTIAELGLDRPNQQRGDNRGESYTQVYTNTLNYHKSFGDHNIDVLAGMEYQKLRGSSLGGRSENFLSGDEDFYILVKNGQDGLFLGGGAGEGAFVGYMGRVSYDYMNKYLVTASIRHDGTSNFSPEDNRRWGTFPSVSAAWRISEEDFFTGIDIISELKLRASWGQLGNSDTQPFPHVFRVSPTPDYGLNGSTTVQAPAPVNFVNQEVIWETVTTMDVGFDLGFMNDKINVLFAYYNRKTEDFLYNLPIPAITGFTTTPTNLGEVSNKGIELEVGYRNTFGDLSVDVSANLTTVTNELVALAPNIEEFTQDEFYRTAVGQPIGYMYGYETSGIYQTDAEAANALPDASSPDGPRAGDVIFVDNNGPASDEAPPGQQFSGQPDGMIDFNDRTYLGKTIPDAYYGLNIGLGYKGFDLSAFFQGVAGVQLYNDFRRFGERMQGGGRNLMATAMNRWTGQGTSNTIPRMVQTDPNSNNRFSDLYVEDAGYLKLKNLQIGYTLPTSLIETTNSLSKLRVYVAATNLFAITDYSGPDPEVYSYRQIRSQTMAGTDGGNMPIPRTFQVGLQLGF